MVATECFHGMMTELGDENPDVDQAEWVLGSLPCRVHIVVYVTIPCQTSGSVSPRN